MAQEVIKKVRVPKSTLPLQGYAPIVSAYVTGASNEFVTYTTSSPHKLIAGSKTDIFGIRPTSFNTTENTLINVASVTENTFTVLKSDLPHQPGNTEILESAGFATIPYALNYLIRYRIVYEDKNQYSHWSPVYNVVNEYNDDVTSTTDGGQEGGDA
jgi:hypothetical protein